uniref:Uncharacterized protein n=1 Tax=Micrurus paraensis TaxID=1970185 RepID=A0A2D4KJB4_9SAUR
MPPLALDIPWRQGGPSPTASPSASRSAGQDEERVGRLVKRNRSHRPPSPYWQLPWSLHPKATNTWAPLALWGGEDPQRGQFGSSHPTFREPPRVLSVCFSGQPPKFQAEGFLILSSSPKFPLAALDGIQVKEKVQSPRQAVPKEQTQTKAEAPTF